MMPPSNSFEMVCKQRSIKFFTPKKIEKTRAEICEQYSSSIYFICLRILKNKTQAKDCTQDVLIKIFLKLQNFKGNSDLRFWIHAIARNHCISYLKQQQRRRVVSLENLTLEEPLHSNLELELENLNQIEHNLLRMEQELKQLSTEIQFILIQKYYKKKTIRDLANELHLSESAVKMRIKRGKEKLKKRMLMAN